MGLKTIKEPKLNHQFFEKTHHFFEISKTWNWQLYYSEFLKEKARTRGSLIWNFFNNQKLKVITKLKNCPTLGRY